MGASPLILLNVNRFIHLNGHLAQDIGIYLVVYIHVISAGGWGLRLRYGGNFTLSCSLTGWLLGRRVYQWLTHAMGFRWRIWTSAG